MTPFEALPQPFARPDVVAAQLCPRAMSRAAAAGSLVVVGKQLYAVHSAWEGASPWVRHRGMAEAAVRLTKDAIVSHVSDAALRGFPHPSHPPDHVSMTLMDDVRTSRSDTWRRFHRGTTPYEHIEIVDGAPRLIAPRTVLDCARDQHPRDALAIADGALRAGATDREALLDMRRQQRHWMGVRQATDVLALADGRRENWLESASAWAIHRWGMPVGVPQVNVFTPDGRFVGRCDYLWPEQGIVGEADGVDKYLLEGSTEEAVVARLQQEEVREKGFTALGLEVVRWGPRDSIDGTEIHARFRAAIRPHGGSAVTAVFRCSCCNQPLDECLVERELARWRADLAKEFAPKVW